jgi:hypothetical protein
LIVGTQVDLRDDPSVREKLAKQKMQPVRKEDGERMAKELGAVKYVECSALTQYKLKDVFDEVCLGILTPALVSYGNKLTWDVCHRLSSLHWSHHNPRRSHTSVFCSDLYHEVRSSTFAYPISTCHWRATRQRYLDGPLYRNHMIPHRYILLQLDT